MNEWQTENGPSTLMQPKSEFIQFVGDDAIGFPNGAVQIEAVPKEIYSSGNFSTADMLKVIVYWTQQRPGAIIKFHELAGQKSSLSSKVQCRPQHTASKSRYFMWNLYNINQSHCDEYS